MKHQNFHTQSRFYKVKNPAKNFLCALCSAPRSLKYNKNLKPMNYLQIILVSGVVTWLLFPLIGEKSLVTVFVVWMAFELINKMLYRKEIPCPYCGFDATWYKRDVKVAHRKVKEYWQTNHPELVKGEEPVGPNANVEQTLEEMERPNTQQ